MFIRKNQSLSQGSLMETFKDPYMPNEETGASMLAVTDTTIILNMTKLATARRYS